MTNIAVIGGGVIGVTSAVAVKEAFPDSRVTIFAEAFTPETTGDGSAGLWGPFVLADTPVIDYHRWGSETHRWLGKLWKSGLAEELGICLVPNTRVSKSQSFSMPLWSSAVYGAVLLSHEQLERLSREHAKNYKGGMHFVTYTAEPPKFLPWLMKKFTSSGGIIQKRRIDSFEELEMNGYDTVINCAGLGARELADDYSLVPVRGQVTRVKAPWILGVFIEDDMPGNYIIPNVESVVTGGSATEEFDTEIRSSDTKFIRDGCSKILPALKESEVLKHWVGLRPRRTRIRLEKEIRSTRRGNKFQIIHNYGHGGAGITMCWGCALHVVELLKGNSNSPRPTSKL